MPNWTDLAVQNEFPGLMMVTINAMEDATQAALNGKREDQ
jgi:hypothetical protein